jgi:hypothetical protein
MFIYNVYKIEAVSNLIQIINNNNINTQFDIQFVML